MDTFTARAATADERANAFRMVFPLDASSDRWNRAESLIRSGQLDPDSIRVLRDSIGLAAALIAAPLPGAAAVVWPPQTRPSLHAPDIALDLLCTDAVMWMKSKGVRVAQSLLSPLDADDAKPLLRCGFERITRLIYLRHFLDLSFDQIATEERYSYRNYDPSNESLFAEILERSYADTRDCPELNHVRTPAEVLAGHRASGPFDPSRWWLAESNGQPVGIVLTTMPEPDTWDIAYLGIVAEARNQGAGRELVRKVLFEAKAAGIPLVTLAVDARNDPARRLYHAAGFEAYDERDVYLQIFNEVA